MQIFNDFFAKRFFKKNDEFKKRKAMCLVQLAEDESENHFVCCGSLHSYAAIMAFSIFDFMAVFITLTIYAFAAMASPSWTNLGPLSALILSICVYPIGPIAIFQQSSKKLTIYRWRLRIIVVFALIWMLLCLFVQEDTVGIFIALIWLIAAILYTLGSSYCTAALEFLNSYRGYDGADPVVLEQISMPSKSIVI
uniref:Uncharacterized protein n=1 Tax=Panagrolaimus sp. PS1159 TaxID=55785 RepID=A0AC35GGL8_9BILA